MVHIVDDFRTRAVILVISGVPPGDIDVPAVYQGHLARNVVTYPADVHILRSVVH